MTPTPHSSEHAFMLNAFALTGSDRHTKTHAYNVYNPLSTYGLLFVLEITFSCLHTQFNRQTTNSDPSVISATTHIFI